MSLSDKKKNTNSTDPAEDNAWEPLDVASLNRFGSETYLKTDRTKPDYSLFTKLYEEPFSEESELFKRWHEIDADENLDGGKGEVHDIVGPDADSVSQEDPQVLSESDEEIKQGYEAGYEEGIKAGQEEGFLKGEKEGYEAGFLKGETEAMEIAAEKAKPIIESLEEILSSMDRAWDGLAKRYETEIISLICKIAEQVVLAKVELDDSLVRQSVVKSLETLPEPEEIILNIAPEDYDYIEMIKEDLFDKIDTLTGVSVVANASVSRGGCTIETAKAKVKTEIESRLAAVFSAITDAGLS